MGASPDAVPCYSCHVNNLAGEIIPSESTFRVSVEKGRVTVTLKKKQSETWSNLKYEAPAQKQEDEEEQPPGLPVVPGSNGMVEMDVCVPEGISEGQPMTIEY